LAGVPAEEVSRVDVAGMGFTAGPEFLGPEKRWGFRRAMQVVGEATVFFACGANQGAEFGFEKHFLAVAWAKLNDEGNGFFGKFGGLSRTRFARTSRLSLGFALRHSGRDSPLIGLENSNPLRPPTKRRAMGLASGENRALDS